MPTILGSSSFTFYSMVIVDSMMSVVVPRVMLGMCSNMAGASVCNYFS